MYTCDKESRSKTLRSRQCKEGGRGSKKVTRFARRHYGTKRSKDTMWMVDIGEKQHWNGVDRQHKNVNTKTQKATLVESTIE